MAVAYAPRQNQSAPLRSPYSNTAHNRAPNVPSVSVLRGHRGGMTERGQLDEADPETFPG